MVGTGRDIMTFRLHWPSGRLSESLIPRAERFLSQRQLLKAPRPQPFISSAPNSIHHSKLRRTNLNCGSCQADQSGQTWPVNVTCEAGTFSRFRPNVLVKWWPSHNTRGETPNQPGHPTVLTAARLNWVWLGFPAFQNMSKYIFWFVRQTWKLSYGSFSNLQE